MSSVGETLRRERLRKELGLEQISRETKISARLLEAIEKDRFDLLPGGVFAKSFVRQYARFLGLEEEEVAAELEKAVHPGGELPSFASAAPEPAYKVPRMVEWEGGGRSNSSVLSALALVVAVMLVCSALYAWWLRSRRPAAVTAPIAAVRRAPTAITKAAEPVPERQVEAPVPQVKQAEAAAVPVDTANPAAALQVSLTADADDWLRVSTDGKVVMSDVLRASEVKTFAAREAVLIRVGNAGSLQITVNGKPAGPLGPKGQVRTVEVTREGVHILPPPPKPAPAAPAPEPL
jgi:cytoskeletal protein RodZ